MKIILILCLLTNISLHRKTKGVKHGHVKSRNLVDKAEVKSNPEKVETKAEPAKKEDPPAKEEAKKTEPAKKDEPAKKEEPKKADTPAKEPEKKADEESEEEVTPKVVVVKQPEPVDETPKCKPELLMSFGFSGMVEPIKKAMLEVCPQVENACCNKDDEMLVYQYWDFGKEEENLIGRMEWHEDVYTDLVHQLERAKELAANMLVKLEKKTVSNCKILARRVNQIQIQVVGPKVLQELRHLHDFFKMSYKGFYCSVCDANKHEFFNIELKQIIYNEEFCRDIVYNSLHMLLYFHAYFIKFVNLVSRFTNSCDYKGNFKDLAVNPKFLFSQHGDHHRMLLKCFKNRNGADWFDSCVKICNKFSLMEYSDFFAPHLIRYSNYNKYLTKKLDAIEEVERKDNLLKQASNMGAATGRLLSAKKTELTEEQKKAENPERLLKQKKKKLTNAEKEEQKVMNMNPDDIYKVDLQRKYKDREIYKSGMNAIIDIKRFKTVIRDPGLNLHQAGKESIITLNSYKAAKAAKSLGERKLVQEQKPKPRVLTGFEGVLKFSIIFLVFLFK